MKKEMPFKIRVVLACLIIGLIIGLITILINKEEEYQAKLQAEKEHQDEMIGSVYAAIEDQYFPLDGEASSIYVVSGSRLNIQFLNGSFENYLAHGGGVYYNYRLSYISDSEYALTAKKDTAPSSETSDYAFSCKLTKDGSGITLSDLKTDDPYPEFEISVMASGDEKKELEEKDLAFFSGAYQYLWSQQNSGDTKSSTSTSSSNSGSSKNEMKRTYNDEIDPADHDIEQYYLDYQDEFEDEDDAWDDFMDNPEYWDDY